MKTKNIIAGILVFTLALPGLESCRKNVANHAPTCKITSPRSGDEFYQGDSVTISVNASDEDGAVADVKFIINAELKETVTQPPYTYVWHTEDESIATHTIVAIATDDAGSKTSDEVRVDIVEGAPPPVADFIASEVNGTIPFTVTFTDQSANNPTSWHWDFGDGNWDITQNPVQTYTKPGVYSVKLVVTNEYGIDSITKTDYITVNQGSNTGTFVDPRDGQEYHYIIIGTQKWMSDNLNIGKQIVNPQNPGQNGIIEKYCFNDDSAYCNKYGGLYTWDEMMQYDTTPGSRGICPPGWHIPTDEEWKTLELFLGMSQEQVDSVSIRGTVEGGKLKETGLAHWVEPNTGATNSVGFNALPGGFRDPYGNYPTANILTRWYSSSQFFTGAWVRGLSFGDSKIDRALPFKTDAYSVRCVKN